MHIKTKYSIGDKVWYLGYGKIESDVIDEVLFSDAPGTRWGKDAQPSRVQSVRYGLRGVRDVMTYDRTGLYHEEEKLFPTKESLIERLVAV